MCKSSREAVLSQESGSAHQGTRTLCLVLDLNLDWLYSYSTSPSPCCGAISAARCPRSLPLNLWPIFIRERLSVDQPIRETDLLCSLDVWTHSRNRPHFCTNYMVNGEPLRVRQYIETS